MSIFLSVGLPGQGKSLWTAFTIWKLLKRNKRWFKKTGIKRKILTNVGISFYEKNIDYITYWDNLIELVNLKNCDVIIDEVADYFDSREWEKLPKRCKTFLRRSDKRGIEIYANTQAPMQVDRAFRRVCDKIYFLQKVLGSRRPSNTRPKPKIIWGLVWIRRLKREAFNKDEDEFEFETDWLNSLHFLWISKWKCNLYDTTQEVNTGELPDYDHLERKCPKCNKIHIIHE